MTSAFDTFTPPHTGPLPPGERKVVLRPILALPGERRWTRLLFLSTIFLSLASPVVLAAEAQPDSATPSSEAGTEPPAVLRPTSARTGVEFDTDRMHGTIELDGAYHGVTRLLDKRSGRQLIDPRYSALNLFKLMSVNQIMGQPRNMDRTIRISPRAIEATWAATDGHKAEIVARYEVPEPNAVEVTVTVRSQGAYRGYELFMSSYFDKVLRPRVYLESRGREPPEWVIPMVSDVFRGTVLVFPRDAHVARYCLDGRWERNEWSTPIVQMCPVRRYADCLALMTDPDDQLGVVLMAHPDDCYAISTRYHAEDDADRLTTYSAFDLSLFGDDLLPGVERRVKVRLALIPLDGELTRPIDLYRAFTAKQKRSPERRPHMHTDPDR